MPSLFAATLKRIVLAAIMVAICTTVLAQRDPGAPAEKVAGDYACRSMGSGPCDTATTISLHPDGTWSWRYFSGHYAVNGATVTFAGAGLGAWGPAVVGTNTLTFTSGGEKVVYAKQSSAPPSIAGSYVCASAPGGCQTYQAIVINSDGNWTWGAQHGTVVTAAGQPQFTGGLSSGPAHWGTVDFDSSGVVFHSPGGDSRWTKRSNDVQGNPCDPRIPRYRQPNCVPQKK